VSKCPEWKKTTEGGPILWECKSRPGIPTCGSGLQR
jgi:hypothetical protein